MDNAHEMEVHHVTVETTTKPLFHAGTVVVLPEAEDMINKQTKENRDKTTAVVGGYVARHITGDFGLMPGENVAENIRRIANGNDCLMSSYSLDGSRTEPCKFDEPSPDGLINLLTFNVEGEPVTYVASNDEIGVLFMGRKLGVYFNPTKPDAKPDARTAKSDAESLRDLMIKLVGMAPAGHA